MRTSLKNQIHAILNKNNIKIPVKYIFAKKSRVFLEKLNDEKINSYLKMIDHVDLEINEIKAKAKSIEQFKKQARLIRKMPGLGDTAAYIILAEIGDIHRFKTPYQLCSYAGIVPSISQSGNKCFVGRITKQGSKWLRWIFIQCANVAINKPNKIQSYFYKLNAKKHRNVAITATARKMIYYLWHMLKNNKPYIDDHITTGVSEA